MAYGIATPISLGWCTSVADVLVALNAEPGKPASVSYSAGMIPGQISILVKNTDCDAFSDLINLTGDRNCNPIIIDVVDPVGDPLPCNANYFPVNVYEPDGLTLIGSAIDIYGVIAMMNSNAAWQAFGVASYYSTCQIAFTKNPTVDPPPVVIVDPNGGSGGGGGTGCIDGIQSYVLTLGDQCIPGHLVTAADFPFNVWVTFPPTGPESLGNVTDMTTLLAALNGAGTKPAGITFSGLPTAFGAPLQIQVTNTNCNVYSNLANIFTDAASSAYLLYGANHGSFLDADFAESGIDGYGMSIRAYLGQIAGLTVDERMWHTITIGNYMITASPAVGSVFFYDITNPQMPVLARRIALNNVAGTNFSGEPESGGQKNFYSLYFPTDTEGLNMSLNEIYIVESVTGSIWRLDFYDSVGVVNSFQDNKLIGKCPRVFTNRIIHFTQDGDLEQTTSQVSGVGIGDAVFLDVDTFSGAGISTKTIILNLIEYVWAASYDGVDTIWYVGQKGTLVQYSLSGAAVVLPRYLNVMVGMANTRLNAKFYNNKLYQSTEGGYSFAYPNTASIIFDISTLGGSNTIVPFQPFTPPAGTGPNRQHWVFKPLNGCTGVLTWENDAGINSGIAVFGYDGTFYGLINNPIKGNIYNVIAIPNVSIYAPNSLV